MRLASSLNRAENFDLATGLSQELGRFVGDYMKFKDPNAASRDITRLSQIACDLALTLRQSKIRYRWLQRPREIDEANYIVYSGYQEEDGEGRQLLYRILFGPIFKVGERDWLLIRQGEMLKPSNN